MDFQKLLLFSLFVAGASAQSPSFNGNPFDSLSGCFTQFTTCRVNNTSNNSGNQFDSIAQCLRETASCAGFGSSPEGNNLGLLSQLLPFASSLLPKSGISAAASQSQGNQEQSERINVGGFDFSQNPIYSTFPFQDQNLTQLLSLWNSFAESVKPALQSPTTEAEGVNNGSPPRQGKFGGGNGTTILGDLNFLTLPQLFNVVGR